MQDVFTTPQHSYTKELIDSATAFAAPDVRPTGQADETAGEPVLRSERSDDAVRCAGWRVAREDRARTRCGRHLLRPGERQDALPSWRIRLREIHHGPNPGGPQPAERRDHPLSGAPASALHGWRHSRAARRHSDDLPGPVQFAQPKDDDRRRSRRTAVVPQTLPDQGGGPRKGCFLSRTGRVGPHYGACAILTNFLAGSASAYRSRRPISLQPDVIIADEAVSALDVTTKLRTSSCSA